MNSKITGFLIAGIGAAAFGLNPFFALPLYKEGYAPATVLFFRFILASLMLACYIKFCKGALLPKKNEIPALFGGAALMAGSSYTLFDAYLYMDSGIVSTILFIYPVAVAGIMALFFKEKLTFKIIASIILSIAGVMVLSRSETKLPFSYLGLILSILSALFYAFYIVAIRVSSLREMPAEKISFYTILLSSFFFLFISCKSGNFQMLSTPFEWGYALGLGFFPSVIALAFTAEAIKRIGATDAAIFGALEPVVAVLCGVVCFGEKFTVNIVIGVILVITGVILVIFNPQQKTAVK